MEEKVSQGNCLYYLEQFTRGQPIHKKTAIIWDHMVIHMVAAMLAAAASAHIVNTKNLTYDCQSFLLLQTVNKTWSVDPSTLNMLNDFRLLCAPGVACPAPLPLTNNALRRQCRQRGMRKQKQGARGGASAKLRANPCRSPLTSLLVANVHSLENKFHHLRLNLTSRQEVRYCY